jgi:hypothetical protein
VSGIDDLGTDSELHECLPETGPQVWPMLRGFTPLPQ